MMVRFHLGAPISDFFQKLLNETRPRKPALPSKYSGRWRELSQDRLSKEAEVAYNTIVKIESGENPNPTVETLERIAKALGISIEKLFKE